MGVLFFVREGVVNINIDMNVTVTTELTDEVPVIKEEGANAINQHGYACLEYANSRFQTVTCIDGGKNPVFNEKIVLILIKNLHEISVSVTNHT